MSLEEGLRVAEDFDLKAPPVRRARLSGPGAFSLHGLIEERRVPG